MTSNKAQKTAARQRMAQTGEPYSVARRAVSAGDPEPDAAQGPGATGTEPRGPSPEEQYAQEARAAGVPAAEIDAQLATFRRQEAAELHTQETADLARRAAERAREQADRLEEAAERSEERADMAEEDWEHHGEPAEPGEPWDFDDEPWEPGAADPRGWHPEGPGIHRPPRPPRPRWDH